MPVESLCRRYVEAARVFDRMEDELVTAWVALVPGSDYQSASCDPSDWDGQSLELYGVTPVGLELTAEKLETVWGWGFTVVRLYYEDKDGSAPRDGISNSMSGDWWAVKGKPPKKCNHTHEATR